MLNHIPQNKEVYGGSRQYSIHSEKRVPKQCPKQCGMLTPLVPIEEPKNLGRLWHAYIRTIGRFYKLQLASVDSWRFTQSEYQLRMWACSGTTSYWKGSWAVINRKCPPLIKVGVSFLYKYFVDLNFQY